ncbi:MAG TPA: SDR family NAD(P)-dependent oxidoreductase [Bacteroidales bacterium]|nr:SDR family NAD(P)-dependent oxidoreductase [Bacteroidales bacterium]HOX76564.1 SDR family NAD(P)-dependent oxidoreductase [Bacteroidales bacterium]HPI85228.1 SDR family NAD(P)-dependent oxidoreductase [Bacteroidales bacterium]HPM92660.1 SDR family NAD(P)-dependent oxidoreductase [Bacteroidales bacterium]
MPKTQKSNYTSPASSTWEGIRAAFARQQKVGSPGPDDRLDGKTVLVDGASSGLGFAVATQMAMLGARVIMACRSGIPEKGEEVKRRTGNKNVEMVYVDFSDMDSIRNLIATLKEEYAPFDIVVSNAAMVPAQSRKTPQGLEEMFMVNYLSKFILINGLINEGCLRRKRDGVPPPRIIFVSSESHRHPAAFDWEGFGIYKTYGMQKTVEYYGYYKLLLTTFARELSRRLNNKGKTEISVFALCPGPVNSGIAREAPGIFQPLMKLVFAMFFKSPKKAAEPVMYLAVSKDQEGKAFDYLFKMTRKDIDEKAEDEENGKRLWKMSENIVKTL